MSSVSVQVLPYVPAQERYDKVYAWLGPVTCREFYGVRNELLAVLRNYGSVGPMGEFLLEGDCDFLQKGEAGLGPTESDPTFFVVDDWYNEKDRFHRVEAEPQAIRPGLLRDVMAFLRLREGWEVYFAVVKGGLLVSADAVQYEGNGFEGCESLEDVEDRCATLQ